MRSDATMPAHVIAQLLEGAGAAVFDDAARARFQAVMAAEGVTPTDCVQPGAQLPLRWFRAVFPDLTADMAARLGYEAGALARRTSYSVLSLPLISAGSVEEALRLLSYMPLISNVVDIHWATQAESVVLTCDVHSGDEILDRIPLLYIAAALPRLLQLLSEEDLGLTVQVAWPLPHTLADHPQVQAGRLQFGASAHQIVVPRHSLEAACRFADPLAYQQACQQLEALLAAQRHAEDTWAGRVQQCLRQEPERRSLAAVADALHVSMSTLKRHLAAEGQTFRGMMEAELAQRARDALRDPQQPLANIAESLGYSDSANFSHAFKRWTGQTPGAWRRAQR